MEYPKISIITPTFNRPDFLEETIVSVLSQDYPNLEYIIIDGGSNHETLKIIEKYKTQLSYWVSEPDEGMYHAIQKGFEKSTGEVMAWLNSDDKYYPGALRIVGQIFSEIEQAEWIIGTPSLLNQDGDCVKIFPNTKWSKSRFWIGDFRWIQQESVFWRRSLWKKSGNTLDLAKSLAADFELWCRFFKIAKLHNVETTLGGFRSHGNQLSVSREEIYEKEVRESLKYIKPQKFEILRFILLKSLWWTKNSLVRLNLQVTNFIASVIFILIEKIHFYPSTIYFDFKNKIWRV